MSLGSALLLAVAAGRAGPWHSPRIAQSICEVLRLYDWMTIASVLLCTADGHRLHGVTVAVLFECTHRMCKITWCLIIDEIMLLIGTVGGAAQFCNPTCVIAVPICQHALLLDSSALRSGGRSPPDMRWQRVHACYDQVFASEFAANAPCHGHMRTCMDVSARPVAFRWDAATPAPRRKANT
jgi:hypothetical protein